MVRSISLYYALGCNLGDRTAGELSGTAIRENAKKVRNESWADVRQCRTFDCPACRSRPTTVEPFTPTIRRPYATPFDPVMFCWSRAKVTFPAASNICTQSTWSHSALYVGPISRRRTDGEPHVLIEANMDEGVVSAPLSKYLHCQTRICRRGPKRSGLRKGLPLRLRTHWSRLRFQERRRPDALSIPMAGDAALGRQTIALGSGDAQPQSSVLR